jgi:hypothetical protein
MACPYFYPVARFETSSWTVPPRLPLGDAYAGECRAASDAFQPDETRVRGTCNVGYGRACCDRFPAGANNDAVRFSMAEDAGELIRIQYIFEKDCWPREHGVLECSAGKVLNAGANEILSSQASAFVASYLRRRG